MCTLKCNVVVLYLKMKSITGTVVIPVWVNFSYFLFCVMVCSPFLVFLVYWYPQVFLIDHTLLLFCLAC